MYQQRGVGFVTVLFIVYVLNLIECMPQFHDRIIGGEPTTIEEHPHQVSLHYQNKHFCGGSIIESSYVLTAAHCVYDLDPNDISVRVGHTYNHLGKKVDVEWIKVHKLYNVQTTDNDIAIIKLVDSLNYTTSVQSIPLPLYNEPTPVALAVATGWGHTKENGHIVDRLRKVSVPIIGLKKCQRMYADIAVVTNRMLCAAIATGGKDSCQGDSGGSLVYNGKLIGIISWGYGCARPGYPGVYTKVAKFIHWINSKIL